MNPLTPFRRPEADPGADWAEQALAPLRRRRADVDVTGLVMRRIADRAPLPVGRALPARWSRVAWAAAFAGGFLALALLVGTAGVMIANGDEGARSTMALASAAGRLAVGGFSHLTAVAMAFGAATVAVLKGAWLLVEVLSPIVRGGSFLAAIGGVASLGVSLVIVSRARRTAPAVAPPGALSHPGGLA
jgi:putative copper export protein